MNFLKILLKRFTLISTKDDLNEEIVDVPSNPLVTAINLTCTAILSSLFHPGCSIRPFYFVKLECHTYYVQFPCDTDTYLLWFALAQCKNAHSRVALITMYWAIPILTVLDLHVSMFIRLDFLTDFWGMI